jgi:hypothetical protein
MNAIVVVGIIILVACCLFSLSVALMWRYGSSYSTPTTTTTTTAQPVVTVTPSGPSVLSRTFVSQVVPSTVPTVVTPTTTVIPRTIVATTNNRRGDPSIGHANPYVNA